MSEAGIPASRPKESRAHSPMESARAKLRSCSNRLKYLWYHKHVFRITNTKFDISYCVFCESFLNDQYGIRKFLDEIGSCDELFFLDVGRNHGLVFYYTVYYIVKKGMRVRTINYYGIDPSPLKFVYFNMFDELRRLGITITYNIIDRAVVFGDETTTRLNYGENNFGNFNVTGSNHARRAASVDGWQARLEFVDLVVDTIHFSKIIDLVKKNADAGTMIIKIDCKNQTDHMFMRILDALSCGGARYLLSCERDGSCDSDVSAYLKEGGRVLTTSNIVGRTPDVERASNSA